MLITVRCLGHEKWIGCWTRGATYSSHLGQRKMDPLSDLPIDSIYKSARETGLFRENLLILATIYVGGAGQVEVVYLSRSVGRNYDGAFFLACEDF